VVKRHLVLGGSEGIGFAYALYRAKQGDHLMIVARRHKRLLEAKTALLNAEAAIVETIEGDLLDRHFRASLWEAQGDFDTILASGPSPPSGSMQEALSGDYDQLVVRGYQSAIAYPLEVMRWGLDLGLRSPGTLYLVGSSASKEPILDSPFFFSATFRRVIDVLANEFAASYQERGKRVVVWHPRVVLTPLSIEYAHRTTGKVLTDEEARALLKQSFDVTHVPTGDKYVLELLEQEEMR